MKIKKLRRKLQDKEWLERKYESLANDSSRWDEFRRFKVDSFFIGGEAAIFNKRKYMKESKRVNRQIKFIKKLLKIK